MTDDSSRDRMVRSAAELMASRGANATSFSEVLEASGAPRGSIYHHFPGGKRQLTALAIELTSARVIAHQSQLIEAGPRGALERFIDMWRQVVIVSGGTAGCAVAGMAVDTAADDASAMNLVRDTFRAWTELLAEQLQSAGIDGPRARAVATTALAAMEGALILCRAEASVQPLESVASELVRLVS